MPGRVTKSDAPAVLTRGLVKVYDDVVAVAGLDLEVVRGECFGLLGPNGAGKTTTVEILEGLVDRDAGEVSLFGRTWEKDEGWLREHVGVSFQTTHLQEKLTVREILELFRAFFLEGKPVDTVLGEVRLHEKADARYETLSGGQKQRVAVACALVGKPELLFLDEPTTGLDPQSRRALWDVVHGFRAQGGTVVLTTHYMDEAEKLCDRVAIVDHGKIIAIGTPAELVASIGAKEVVTVRLAPGEVPVVDDGAAEDDALDPGAPDAAEAPKKAAPPDPLARALEAVAGVVTVRREPDAYAMTVRELHDALPEILATLEREKANVLGLTTHRATLEDVFIELTGRQLRE